MWKYWETQNQIQSIILNFAYFKSVLFCEYSWFVNFGCEKLILLIFLLLKDMSMEDAGSPITVGVSEVALYESKIVFMHN